MYIVKWLLILISSKEFFTGFVVLKQPELFI